MEPLSQALLGASVGYATSGRKLGRRALGWGALFGMLPDLDVFLGGLQGGMGEMLYHRGSTHALWFGPVVGPLLGWLLWRWRDRARTTPCRAWQKLGVLALVTHPLLDVFTPYGTQFFAPFWRHRFAWNGVGIIDPWYTAPLALAVLTALVMARRHVIAKRACLLGIAIGAAYLLAGVGLNEWARADARRTLGWAQAEVEVYPTLMQPLLRRVTAQQGDRRFVGWHTTLQSGCLHGFHFEELRDPRLDDLRRSRLGKRFIWYALGNVTGGISESEHGKTRVMLEDLRYAGLGTPPRQGLWGIEADYDPQGQRVSEPRRFYRDIDERDGLRALWRGMRGDFSAGGGGEQICRRRAAPAGGASPLPQP